jgi:hypothetical protein
MNHGQEFRLLVVSVQNDKYNRGLGHFLVCFSVCAAQFSAFLLLRAVVLIQGRTSRQSVAPTILGFLETFREM